LKNCKNRRMLGALLPDPLASGSSPPNFLTVTMKFVMVKLAYL